MSYAPSARRTATAFAFSALLAVGALPAAALASAPAACPTATLAAAPLPADNGQDAAKTRTWALEPATAEGQEKRVSVRLELDPGASASDAVTVRNFSPEELTFKLTPSDGIVTPEGVFDILPSDQEPEDVGTWIDIAPEVTVPAEGEATVPFTLTVPKDAIPGDHPGGITASVITKSVDGSGNAVTLDARVGVRIHLRVSGDLVPQVEIQDLKAEYVPSWNPFARGRLNLTYTVANTGNVRVGATQVADIDGPLGIPAGAKPGELPNAAEITRSGVTLPDGSIANQREVLPRQSSAQSVSVPVWPLFHLSADVTSIQNVVGEDVIEAQLTDASAEVGVWAIPLPQLIVLALIVGVILFMRGRKKATQKRIDEAVAKARAEGAAQARAEGAGEAHTDDAAQARAEDAGESKGESAE